LAYPAGGHDGSVVQMLHDVGVELALTCCEGHNRVGETDPCEFRRTVMTLRTTRQVFSLRLTALGSHIDRWRRRIASEGVVRLTRSPLPSLRPGGRGSTLEVQPRGNTRG
jgi:hypothetical protein